MNSFEKRLKQHLKEENPDCEVLRNGWPDFLVVEKSTGRIRKAVEGKAIGDCVQPHQREIHAALRASGIAVEESHEWGSGFLSRGL